MGVRFAALRQFSSGSSLNGFHRETSDKNDDEPRKFLSLAFGFQEINVRGKISWQRLSVAMFTGTKIWEGCLPTLSLSMCSWVMNVPCMQRLTNAFTGLDNVFDTLHQCIEG